MAGSRASFKHCARGHLVTLQAATLPGRDSSVSFVYWGHVHEDDAIQCAGSPEDAVVLVDAG